MKRIISIILALIVILSAMTSTVFAHSNVDEHNAETASINGAIGTCPSCGGAAWRTCNGDADHTTTSTCTAHEECEITNTWYYTYSECICGFSLTVGRHVHSLRHSSNNAIYTVCIYL